VVTGDAEAQRRMDELVAALRAAYGPTKVLTA
jgi:hypothetical protein